MENIAKAFSKFILDNIDFEAERSKSSSELRYVFNGPPLEYLRFIKEHLTIRGELKYNGKNLPVLVVNEELDPSYINPDADQSGECATTHLINKRNLPINPNFIALIPPNVSNISSITTTTYEIGLKSENNSKYTKFNEWYNDPFIIKIIEDGIKNLNLNCDDVKGLFEEVCTSIDELHTNTSSREEIWERISCLYDDIPTNMSHIDYFCFICGLPSSMNPNQIDGDQRLSIVGTKGRLTKKIVQGTQSFIDELKVGQKLNEEDEEEIQKFVSSLEANSNVVLTNERRFIGLYAPYKSNKLDYDSTWWKYFTFQKWLELLTEDEEEPYPIGRIDIDCINVLDNQLPRSTIPFVKENIELQITVPEPLVGALKRTRGNFEVKIIDVSDSVSFIDNDIVNHDTPFRYIFSSEGFQDSFVRVISLSKWKPGIILTTRNAHRIDHPRKNTKLGKNKWKSLIKFDGIGYAQIKMYLSPYITLITEECYITINDDDDQKTKLKIIDSGNGYLYFNVDIETNSDIFINYVNSIQDPIKQTLVIDTEIEEEIHAASYISYFEYLIAHNNNPALSPNPIFISENTKLSSIQDYLLDNEKSFYPVVLSTDTSETFKIPEFSNDNHKKISNFNFIFDPRPHPKDINPPQEYIKARKKLIEYVTSNDNRKLESYYLGEIFSLDDEFKEKIYDYLDYYLKWHENDKDVAIWSDIFSIHLPLPGNNLDNIPVMVLVSPLHPLRIGWHCEAQRILFESIVTKTHCPAGSILNSFQVPDSMTLPFKEADGTYENKTFYSIETNNDYWSVLWNTDYLDKFLEYNSQPPFDGSLGIKLGGITSGFSQSQVVKALKDVSEIISVKPQLNILIKSSAGGTADSCNDGLKEWSREKFISQEFLNKKIANIFDCRSQELQPDNSSIMTIVDETGGRIKWYNGYKIKKYTPDIGIITQLNSSNSKRPTSGGETQSPLGAGGIIRHRIRKQLVEEGGQAHGSFIDETRSPHQVKNGISSDMQDKLYNVLVKVEESESNNQLRFAPSIAEINSVLVDDNSDYVAISSSNVDPATFLGQWMEKSYLWDYELPSYSKRSGDTNGYYLISKIKETDKDRLKHLLSTLPECTDIETSQLEAMLREIARRGIPTIKGLFGENAKATGDLGIFLGSRILQDGFRLQSNLKSLLPIIEKNSTNYKISLVIPVDPFENYISDLFSGLNNIFKNIYYYRPDLLVICIEKINQKIFLKITPIEIKYRSNTFGHANHALVQTRNFSNLFDKIQELSEKNQLWKLAGQQLLNQMIGFGFRIYSQHEDIIKEPKEWSKIHQEVISLIMNWPNENINFDNKGRLIVFEDIETSRYEDNDNDNFKETIRISKEDSSSIILNDEPEIYNNIKNKLGDWLLFPEVEGNTQIRGDDTGGDDIGGDDTGGDDSGGDDSGITTQTSDGIKIYVGNSVNSFNDEKVELNISNTLLNQLNVGVVGDLGTGKTQFLQSYISQVVNSGNANRGVKPRFLILDYKKDYSKPEFVEATGAKVLLPQHLPFNIFDLSSSKNTLNPKLDKWRLFQDALGKIFSNIGYVQGEKIKQSVLDSYKNLPNGVYPTIYEVFENYKSLSGSSIDAPYSIMSYIVDLELFQKDQSQTQSFEDFFNGVVVISLGELGVDDKTKNMLVVFMLNLFYEAMLNFKKKEYTGNNPQLRFIDSYLLVDEADNIMKYEFDVLKQLLLQGREFGTGVILGSQYLSSFKSGATNYIEPLLTWFIHKVPQVKINELKEIGMSHADSQSFIERIQNLNIHQCLYKTSGRSPSIIKGKPFYELYKDGNFNS